MTTAASAGGGMSLGPMFFELKARTDELGADVAQARREVERAVSKAIVVPVTANTARLEAEVKAVVRKARATTKDAVTVTPRLDQRQFDKDLAKAEKALEKTFRDAELLTGEKHLSVDADISALQRDLKVARAALKEVGVGGPGQPTPAMVAKIDADIGGYLLKLKRAKVALKEATLEKDGAKSELKFDAIADALAKTRVGLDKTYDSMDKLTGNTKFTDQLKGFATSFRMTGTSAAGMESAVISALTSPIAAGGVLAGVFVTIAAAGTKMAADVDAGVRQVRAAIPDTNADLSAVVETARDLSLETGIAQTSLLGLAAALAKVGNSNPAEIAAHMRTLALAADALGGVDPTSLVGGLDLLQDAFALTANEADNAFTQIVAMAKGRIDFSELIQVLERSATGLRKVNVTAVDAAAAVATLIDAGVSKRKVGTALPALLDEVAGATEKAAAAARAGNVEAARDLAVLAKAMSEANIQSKGVIGAMADLYQGLGGLSNRFENAGLSASSFEISMKAADAAANGATASVLSVEQATKQLQDAAGTTRESAGRMAALLKEQLHAVLIDLGNVALPLVLGGLDRMIRLFDVISGSVPGFVRQARAAAKEMREIEASRGKASGAPGSYAAVSGTDPASRFGTFEARTNLQIALKKPGVIQNSTVDDLREYLGILDEVKGAEKEVAAVRDELATRSTRAAREQIEASTKDAETRERTERESADRRKQAIAELGREQAKAQKKLMDEYLSMSDQLSRIQDPFAAQARSIQRWGEAMAKEGMKPAELKANIEALNTALDARRAEAAADALAKFNAQMLVLGGNVAGTAQQAIESQADALTKELDALEKLAGANAQYIALQRERIAQLRASAAAMGEVALANSDIDDATRAAADAQREYQRVLDGLSKADLGAVYVTLQDALAKMRENEERLEAQIESGTLTVVQRKKAEEDLAKAIRARQTIEEGKAPASKDIRSAADETIRFGNNLRDSASAALALVQALGQGSSKLAQMLAGAASVGNGLGDLGGLAKKAGGFGALFSTGAGLMSAAGPALAVVGGLRAISDSLDLFGKGAQARRVAMAKAAKEFNDDLDGFAVRVATDLQRNLRAIVERANPIIQKAGAATGFGQTGSVSTLEELNDWIAALQREVANGAGGNQAFVHSLIAVRDAVVANIEVEREKARVALAVMAEDVRVRELLVAGMDGAASTMRDQLALERQITKLREEYGDAAEPLIASLKNVTAAEIAAAQAAEKYANALALLDEDFKILGGSPGNQLRSTILTIGSIDERFRGMFDDLDLTTKEGLDAAKAKLKDFYVSLTKDGSLSDADKKAVALIERLFNGIDAVLDSFNVDLTPLERMQKALDAFGVSIDVFGMTAQQQLNGYANIFRNALPEVDELLRDADLSTGSGRSELAARIKNQIDEILGDGLISEAEAPILEALRTLLRLIGQVATDAQETADQAAADQEATRQRNRTKRQRDAGVNIELGDLEGADAFLETLRGFGDEFSAMLGDISVDGLPAIGAAKASLKQLYVDIAAMSDEEIMARFGMTRDEVVDAIVALDTGLDTLKDTANAAADATKELAAAQRDFVDGVNNDYLDATGNSLDAGINRINQDTQRKVGTATSLELPQEIIDRIIETGRLKVEEFRAEWAAQSQKELDELARQAAETAAKNTPEKLTAQETFRSSSVTQISGGQALVITDYLASSLVEQRATRLATEASRVAQEAMVGLLSQMLASGTALTTPMLPPATLANTATGGAGGITLSVNFNGPIANPQIAANEFLKTAMPVIDAYMARTAAIEATGAGRPFS